MERENVRKDKTIYFYIGIFIFNGIIAGSASYFLGRSYEEILRNVIVNFISAGTIIFMLADNDQRDAFLYGNINRKNVFIMIYAGAMVMACVLPLINCAAWPYLFVFVLLGLFSNGEIGLFSGASLVMMSVMLIEEGSASVFFMYFAAGAVGIALFRELTEETKIGFPLFVSILMQFVLLICYHVLFLNTSLTVSIVIVPIVNVIIDSILLAVILNFFGIYIIRKSNDMYMDINDPEFSLLVDIKNKNKEEYYRSIHTAYLAERVAMDLDINSRAVKTLSYYGRANKVYGTNSWAETEHFYTDNNFPVEVLEFLHEYIEPDNKTVRTTEYTVTSLCDMVVSSIMYLIHKDKDARINYDDVIDKLFEHKLENKELNNNDISMYQLERMKKLLKKEKLYYDFLR